MNKKYQMMTDQLTDWTLRLQRTICDFLAHLVLFNSPVIRIKHLPAFWKLLLQLLYARR